CTDSVIRINHRELLTAILRRAGVGAHQQNDALIALDKLDKIGPQGVDAEVSDRGVEEQARNAILAVFLQDVNERDSLPRVATFVAGDEAGSQAVANLQAITGLTEQTNAAGKLRLDPSLARGLSYYTGAIMEINVADLA